MPTVKEIFRVARLMDQTGEPKSGFLREEDADLEGKRPPLRKSRGKKRASKRSNGVTFRIYHKEDPETGRLHLVQELVDKPGQKD